MKIIDVRKDNFTAVHTLAEDTFLIVEDMKHGIGQKGSIGVFVDIGTEAIISELKVTCTD